MVNQFWQTPSKWPKDTPEYVFLARAFDKIGAKMFPEKWSKEEEKPGQKLPLEEKPEQELDLDADDEDDEDDLALTEAQEAHEAMWVTIKDEIVKHCLSDKLDTAVRKLKGGMMTKLKPEMWNAENLDWRFHRCQMSLSSPFHKSRYGDTHWIFLGRERLDRFLGTLPYHSSATEIPIYLSPYLKLALDVAKSLGITADNQPKKEMVKKEIEERWRFQPSKKLIDAMATLIREPESQKGRAKKK